ncbi:MAG TPA: hypothetical protein VGP63_27415 [Planctomycetaceae bacterium]|nr:hypothetical protein [Planctomycetaceae bacterium]
MLEMVEVIEGDQPDKPTPEQSRLLQLPAAACVVGQVNGDEWEAPTPRDDQTGVNERNATERNRGDCCGRQNADAERLTEQGGPLRAMRPPSPQPKSELQRRTAEESAGERTMRGGPFDVVGIEQVTMVVKVRESVGRPATKREELNQAEQQPIDSRRQMKRPMD